MWSVEWKEVTVATVIGGQVRTETVRSRNNDAAVLAAIACEDVRMTESLSLQATSDNVSLVAGHFPIP